MDSQLKQMVTQKLLNMFYKSGNNLFPHSVLLVPQHFPRGGTPEITISYPEEILHIISYHLFSFHRSAQDYIIHMDMENRHIGWD